MPCPLCGHAADRPSWLGSTRYRGRDFPYVECASCHTLYCKPMPDGATLAAMYGVDYQSGFAHDEAIEDPKEPGRVLEWLRSIGGGSFIDYGCGKGDLLVRARGVGWRVAGVELDPEVAVRAAGETGLSVVSDPDDLLASGEAPADALHLGDVIEHLTDLDRQMPAILRLLKPEGVLIAQGPLEANANLFTWVLRLARGVRGRKPPEMAPYHVLLATARGQRALFRRSGLEELEYRIREVSWPAPGVLTAADWRRPRALGLFALRRLSAGISALAPRNLGNRYFYAGRKGPPPAAPQSGGRAVLPCPT